jgi:hypothetical protein
MMSVMGEERGTSPEFPDVPPLYPRYFPGGLPPEHSQREVAKIAEERSREDEALRGKRPSLWRRLFRH